MKKFLTTVMVFSFILAGSTLKAQDKAEKAEVPEKAAGKDAGMAAWEKYMAVGEMHKMLAGAEGEWKEEMKFWESPGSQPQIASASCKYTMVLGGRYQESHHEGEVMGMPFEGHGLVGYDNIKKVFQSTWVDNMGTGIMYAEGPYDDKTKSITMKGKSVDPMSGKEMSVREVYTFVEDNHHKFEMYMMKDGKEFKSMEINYRR